MTNQADSKINITIKEVELVEMGKEKHDETLAKIEAKADKVEFDDLKNTVSENQTQLQEQLQSQSDRINTKLDEVSVKALIAEAELDDLTLEQVQQEIIKQVADKASSRAVTEANQAQDTKIDSKADTSYVDNIKQSLEDKDGELEESLAGKANAAHTHSFDEITDKPETYTPSGHNHTVDDITGLNDRLSTLVSDETLQNLLKQYSPITVKTTVEQLQNSLEAKADNTQLESLRGLIESVSSELTAKIQKLSDQLQEAAAHPPKGTKSEEVHQDAPDPAPARAEEPVAVSDETDDAIEGQDPEIKRIIDNLTLDSYQEVMGNDKRPVNTTTFDKVRIKFNKEVEDSSWVTDFPSIRFNKDSEGYYTATNVDGGTMLSGYFSMYDAEDPSVQIVEVVFIDRGVKYVKKFDLIPEDDTDRRQRKYSNTW